MAKSAYSGLGEDYRRGGETAAVSIIVFSDFQCPACRAMNETLRALEREYGERLQVVYRNYPLDQSCNKSMQGTMHAYACKLAILARCAGQYGKFWDYHDLVFAQQNKVQEGVAEAWASEVGLSVEQVSSCLSSKSILEKLEDDIKLGNQLGIDATPTVFINGHKVLNSNIDVLRAEIDHILLKT